MKRHTLRIKWHKDIKGKKGSQDLLVKSTYNKKAKVAILEAKYNSR